MCGIAGTLSLDGRPADGDELAAMCAALVHRGPDDDGFRVSGPVGLAMRRLSIIDLETGKQPVRNEDGSVWAVFNGEIYNYRALRQDLLARGHRFYTETDTEVIVHLYEEHGEGCVERMRGMFAFAVWDERRRALLLARDRVGIKPLFYAEVAGKLVFASELKAILQLPYVERRLDWTAVSHLFTFLSTPASQSVVAGVRKLEPGHTLSVTLGGATALRRYWDLECVPDHGGREEEWTERLRAELEESVRLHLVSDVPVGAFLSGGMDSSTVVATMARLRGDAIKTFSIGFKEGSYDELSYARLASRKFGTEHHELVVEPEVVDVLENLVWCLDEPFGDSSAIPTYMVSKLASEHVKVVLSGDGGDELFAGYDKYRVEQRERRYERMLTPIRWLLGAAAQAAPEGMRGRGFLRHMSLSGPRRYIDASTFFSAEARQALFQPELSARVGDYDPCAEAAGYMEGVGGHWLSRLQYLDIKTYLPLDILTKVDRMSMAHSVEARVPLLDHQLIEFVATIPAGLKLRKGDGKYILKRAMAGVVPDEILHRPKRGFAIPLAQWFRGDLAGFVREVLFSESARERGLFDLGYVERLLRRHDQGQPLDLQIWTLVSFELWCRTFLDRRPSPAPVASASRRRGNQAVSPKPMFAQA